MTTITWRELRENLADMINRVRYQNERIAITRHGKVVAELIPSQTRESDPSADPLQPVVSVHTNAAMPVPQALARAVGR